MTEFKPPTHRMKKPEKRKTCVRHMQSCGKCHECLIDKSYNQCWDDYEKFLPSESEILNILRDTDYMKYSPVTEDREVDEMVIAKAISKRIRE